MDLQKLFLKILFNRNKKDLYFFSDEKAYFINYLSNKPNTNNSINLYFSPSTSNFKKIKILFNQFFAIIFREKYKKLSLFLLPNNKVNNKSKINTSLFNDLECKYLNKKYINYLSNQIISNILTTINFSDYLEGTLKNIKIKKSYFHSMRFPDLFALSRKLSKENNYTYLISHGSHTIQKKGEEADLIASKSLGIGLTYTYGENIELLSQSLYCDHFLDSLNLKYSKINFIIGKKIDHLKEKKTPINNNHKTKILYIGTVKNLGSRRYYYESSSEFFYSIFDIYNKLKKYKNLFSIKIMIREVEYEISNQILKNAFKDKLDLISFERNKSIEEEINNCDCLISFSSTTMEEGLNINKPVMCYGLPGYRHFQAYEDLQLKNMILPSNLQKIENILGRKFIIKNEYERKVDFNL